MATVTSLLFTNQNNLVKVKYIGHGTKVQPKVYTVADIRHHVIYHRQQGAIVHIPLSGVFHKDTWTSVGSTKITKALHAALHITGPKVFFTPE